jgi:hypothetical protein
VRYRKDASGKQGKRAGNIDSKGDSDVGFGQGGLKKLGILNRLPTWNKNKYDHAEERRAFKGAATNEEDFDPLVRNIGGEGIEEDEEQELHPAGEQRGIAMNFLKSEPRSVRDVDSAYEPYRVV